MIKRENKINIMYYFKRESRENTSIKDRKNKREYKNKIETIQKSHIIA